MVEKLHVISVSNDRYIPHLKVLLSSLNATNRDLKIHIILVNVQEYICNDIKNTCSDISVIHKSKIFESIEHEVGYCANIRVEAIHDLLKNEKVSRLLYLDADSIVRSRLQKQILKLNDNDIVILRRNYEKKELRYATGVIFFKNTLQTRKFVEKWKINLEPYLFNWFSDQETFLKTLEEFDENIKIGNLPKNYIDWNYHHNSTIWVGKGSRKYDNELYKLEENYFLQREKRLNVMLIRMKILKLRFTMLLEKLFNN